jgi:hypothetical protein
MNGGVRRSALPGTSARLQMLSAEREVRRGQSVATRSQTHSDGGGDKGGEEDGGARDRSMHQS